MFSNYSDFDTSPAKLASEPCETTDPAPVGYPDSELIQEVVLPVDRMLVTPLVVMSPVLLCFFNFNPYRKEINSNF